MRLGLELKSSLKIIQSYAKPTDLTLPLGTLLTKLKKKKQLDKD